MSHRGGLRNVCFVPEKGSLPAKPCPANEDPLDAGWMVLLKPADWWAGSKSSLTLGMEEAAKYEAKLAADGFAGCGS